MLISKFSVSNPIKEEDILILEQKYNVSLSEDHKKFLLLYNGGYTPKTKFCMNKVSSDLRGFYGIGEVPLSLEKIEINEWAERDLLPIASDSFGNFIVINNNGGILFSDHEKNFKTTFLADNIKTFFCKCKSEIISENSKKSIREREQELIAAGRADIISDGLRKIWQAEIDKYSKMVQEEIII